MARTQVTLLTAGDPERVTGGYLFHRRMAEAAPRLGAAVRFVSIPAWPVAWAMSTGPFWLRSPVLRDADIVVLDSIAAAAAAPWLGRLHAPVVGMLHQPPGGIGAGWLERRVTAAFDGWAYRRAELLMVASDWLAEQLVASGVARSRLRVVPPGKNPAPDDASVPRPETDHGLRRGRRSAALCVANWLPGKGIVELLDAVGRLPDDLVTLHLAGATAGGGYAGRVRRRLQARDLRDRVVVHGIVPPTTVNGLYRKADFFVLPSFEESYGTVWGEAMAVGLAVVGWRAGNLPFLVDHGREGFMAPPGDVLALAGFIERLARDEELRGAMGAAAAQRAAARPTWDETAAVFFGTLDEVLGRQQHGTSV